MFFHRFLRRPSSLAGRRAALAFAALLCVSPAAIEQTAHAATAASEIQISLTIYDVCTMNTDDAQPQVECSAGTPFRVYRDGFFARGNEPATGTLTVACTHNDAYSIAISAGTGSGASVADRMMTRSGGTDRIHYQLYQNASYSLPWGDGTNGTTALAGTGTGSTQSVTVYARVLPQTTPQAGTYIDTVIATITY